MLPGPTYIYQCPNCINLLRIGSLMSGNTFGAERYSDGKMIAPMLPEYPEITKCSKCNTIFWLDKAQKVGEILWNERSEIFEEWGNSEAAKFLTTHDYFKALEGKVYDAKDTLMAEKHFRKAYNLDPENINNINNLSWVLIRSGINVEEGLALSEKGLEKRPDSMRFLWLKGLALHKLGKHEEALAILKEADEISRSYQGTLQNDIQEVEQALANQNK